MNRLFREIVGGDVPTGRTQETSGNPRRIPVRLRLGFKAPGPRTGAALAGPGADSLQRFLTARPDLSSVKVSIDADGLVTLVGRVSEPSTWRLAANLIRLQPGVRRIQNQIEVDGSNVPVN
ncbi:MAG: BON domain-containing protein [Fuerstiella sp.]|nr:BON domain-containing protein [Fuerstiella sp.]